MKRQGGGEEKATAARWAGTMEAVMRSTQLQSSPMAMAWSGGGVPASAPFDKHNNTNNIVVVIICVVCINGGGASAGRIDMSVRGTTLSFATIAVLNH